MVGPPAIDSLSLLDSERVAPRIEPSSDRLLSELTVAAGIETSFSSLFRSNEDFVPHGSFDIRF